jgi:hypothetical protein
VIQNVLDVLSRDFGGLDTEGVGEQREAKSGDGR